MRAFGLTDKGKVRKENQDSFQIVMIDEKSCLMAVLCDGMGGAAAGGVASGLAARVFSEFMSVRLRSSKAREDVVRMLHGALESANGIIYDYSCFDKAYLGMGTTLVAAVLRGSKAYLANIGDSRAYFLSRKKIDLLTKDHSLVFELVERGVLTEREAQSHPQKNIITRALGIDGKAEADYYITDVGKGDMILLCSDGLTNLVTEREILQARKQNPSPEALCKALVNLAMERGASDNVTVVIIER